MESKKHRHRYTKQRPTAAAMEVTSVDYTHTNDSTFPPMKRYKQPPVRRLPARQFNINCPKGTTPNNFVREPTARRPTTTTTNLYPRGRTELDFASASLTNTSPYAITSTPKNMSISSPGSSSFTPSSFNSNAYVKGPSSLGMKAVTMGNMKAIDEKSSSSSIYESSMFSSPGSSFSPCFKKDRRPSCRTDEDDDPMSLPRAPSHNTSPPRHSPKQGLDYCLLGRSQMPKTSPPPAHPQFQTPPETVTLHRSRHMLFSQSHHHQQTTPDFVFKRAPSTRSIASVSTRGSRSLARDASRRSMISRASTVSSSGMELEQAYRTMHDSGLSQPTQHTSNVLRSGMAEPVSMYLSNGGGRSNNHYNYNNYNNYSYHDSSMEDVAETHSFAPPPRGK